MIADLKKTNHQATTRCILVLLLPLIWLQGCSISSTHPENIQHLPCDYSQKINEIIAHYHNPSDTLKVKAAKFLLENITYHYSYSDEITNDADYTYETIGELPASEREARFKTLSWQAEHSENKYLYDCDRLSSASIIKMVDEAFSNTQGSAWTKGYSFDIFCKYILPYRISSEELSEWRTAYRNAYISKLTQINFEAGRTYEAEHAAIRNAQLISFDKGSVWTAVKLAPGNGQVSFEIHAPKTGSYTVLLIYSNSAPGDVDLTLNTDSSRRFKLTQTPDWHSPLSFRLSARFKRGKNKLTFTASKHDLAIDRLELLPDIQYNQTHTLQNGGVYKISNKETRRALTVNSLENWSKVFSSAVTKDKQTQTFKLKNIEIGFWQIHPILEGHSDRIISAGFFPSRDEATQIEVWTNFYNNNQKWAIAEDNNGWFSIVNRYSGKYLEDTGTRIANRNADNSDRQKWKIDWIADSGEDQHKDSLKIVGQTLLDATNEFQFYMMSNDIEEVDPLSLLKYKYGSCAQEAYFQTYMLRSLGFAATVDFVPQWPFRSMGHSWSVIIDKDGSTIENHNHSRIGDHIWVHDWKKGKVYRRTYAINPESLVIGNSGNELIPGFLNNPHLLDVTHIYCDTASTIVKVKFNTETDNRFGYLTVFDNARWIPVAGSKLDNTALVKFKNIEKGVMFLPAFYSEKKILPLASPFHISSTGEKKVLDPDKKNLQTLTLRRKYPYLVGHPWIDNKMAGGYFEVSNRSDFSDAVKIGNVTAEMASPNFHTIDVTNTGSYKFIRYVSPPGSNCMVSEIIFYDKNGSPLHGEVIGTPGSKNGDGRTRDAVFDSNVLTHFEAPLADGAWVGMQYTKPVSIGKIRFVPRNDGNFIEIGDTYELTYWDNAWITIGTQSATSDSVVFDQVPSNALYLLHNITKGLEERIFTYEDGKQIWW